LLKKFSDPGNSERTTATRIKHGHSNQFASPQQTICDRMPTSCDKPQKIGVRMQAYRRSKQEGMRNTIVPALAPPKPDPSVKSRALRQFDRIRIKKLHCGYEALCYFSDCLLIFPSRVEWH